LGGGGPSNKLRQGKKNQRVPPSKKKKNSNSQKNHLGGKKKKKPEIQFFGKGWPTQREGGRGGKFSVSRKTTGMKKKEGGKMNSILSGGKEK